MIPHSPAGFYRIPTHLRDELTRDPHGDPWAGFSAAMAYASAGFAVLPVAPGGKAPISTGPFRNGAKSATNDREAVRDAFVENPGANVGTAPDGRWVWLDIDIQYAKLDTAATFGIPIDGYRERSARNGYHLPLLMPSGFVAEKSATLARGVELIATDKYAVSPHSRLDGGGWYHVEPGRDVWGWGAIPAGWPYLDRLTRQEPAVHALGKITPARRREARRVIAGLHAAPAEISHDVRFLMAGIVPADASSSEADYRLALLASFHTRTPETIAAVLESSGLSRPKWREHETYLAVTIANALARRKVLAAEKLAKKGARDSYADSSSIGSLIDAGNRLPAGLAGVPQVPTCELSGHFLCGGAKNRVASAVLAFLAGVQASGLDSPFSRAENWIRFPVCDLAKWLDVDRKTIARGLEKLDLAGLIERQTVVTRVTGSARADSLVRFTNRGLEAVL